MIAVSLAPFLLEVHDGLAPRLARVVAAALAVVGAIACAFLVVGARNVPGDIAAGSRVYLVLCALTALVALGQAALAHSGRAVVRLLVGALLAAEVASALLLPILGRYMPVPRLARALVREARAGDAAVVWQSSIHSLMFYAERPTVVARNEAELLAAIPEGGRAFVLGYDEEMGGLGTFPGLRLKTVDRAPYFKFNFARNVRGRGRSSEDLVLLEVTRAFPGGPPK